jgi:anti-sigma B factor antagonist
VRRAAIALGAGDWKVIRRSSPRHVHHVFSEKACAQAQRGGVMKIHERTVGEVVILAVDGDITLGDASATGLAERVRELVRNGHDRVVLDLGRVRHVDSAGLGDLVQCCAAVRTRDGAVKLLNVARRLNDLLVVTRLLTVFDCFDDEADAVAAFGLPASPSF